MAFSGPHKVCSYGSRNLRLVHLNPTVFKVFKKGAFDMADRLFDLCEIENVVVQKRNDAMQI